ncbi:MAG: VCBS repeat-containing protein [Planctomycetes bacterium]|nr:VCBS repeat-containing protein [Planctomycetota bacterium]
MKYSAMILSGLIIVGGLVVGCAASSEARIKAIGEISGQGKLDEAKAEFIKLLKTDPKCVKAHYELGGIYRALNDNANANTEFNTALNIDPTFYDAYYELWDMELENAKAEPVKTEAKTSIKARLDKLLGSAKPTDKLYALAFEIYDKIDEKAKSEEVKQLFLSKFPDSDKMDDVGQTAFEQMLAATQGENRPKRAPLGEAFVRDFPRHKMTDIVYRFLLGYYWKEAKPPDPETVSSPHWGLNQPIADGLGAKVRQYAGAWTASKPESPLALGTSALVYAELNIDIDQAVKWANDAVKYIMKDAPTLAEWGQSDKKPVWYYEWQFTDEIRPFQTLDTLGWVYFKKGDLSQAEKYINQAMQYEDFHSRIWYHLGKVYEAQGKLDEALDALCHSLISRNDVPDAPTAINELLKKKFPDIRTQPLRAGAVQPPVGAGHGTPDALADKFQQLPRDLATKAGIPFFTEVTTETGLAKVSGRGVAWGDYDNDGRQDILFNGSYLWRNKGDGTFEDVTAQAKLTGGYGSGVWADYNNDGFLDFFAFGDADALWKNNGDGTFTNVTAEVNPKMSDGYPTLAVGWGDYDRDGFVDLYVANYERPFGVGNPDFLWKNIKGERFEDVTASAGVVPTKNMCGRGVNWGDYNNDGWLDIFVSNYRLNPDFLWKNNGNGTFTNVAREVGVEGKPVNNAYGHTIGSEWADYDNDGNLDLFQANLAHPRYITFSNMSYLLHNNGASRCPEGIRGAPLVSIGAPEYHFTECRRESGIRYEETHSDAAWGDFDNDGLLDLYIASCYPNVPSFLYRQSPKGKFTDVTWLTGTRATDTWGCTWADYDNDGDLDLMVCEQGKVHLFRNEMISNTVIASEPKGGARQSHNWLEVKLVGKDCNKSAIGARLILKTKPQGEIPIISLSVLNKPGRSSQQYMREVEGGKGAGNQNSLVQHFGLGDYNGKLDLSVRWPCGKTTTHQVEPNKIVTIQEP